MDVPIGKTSKTDIVKASWCCERRSQNYETDRLVCKSLIHSSQQTRSRSRPEFK
ncbi:MAG: hypothetical protein HC849_07675 [Oscillatoriales cyanobacterium RU_3_3]|nr:hypothetical protein [Microcoleus sp. SM1_3_4]NJM60082.1 hypothetical protein [Oscillatoriales cyanobacterium RU_3_3]